MNSLWNSEHETFSNFTESMLRSIERDTDDADAKSEQQFYTMENEYNWGVRKHLPKIPGQCQNCGAEKLCEIPKIRNGIHGVICKDCEDVTYDEYRGHPSYQLTGVN